MDDVKKKALTQHQLRAELEARKSLLDQHLSGLQSELTLADVNVGGRPMLDYVREKPLLAAGVAAGVGLLAGVLSSLRSRPEPEEPSDYTLWMNAYLDDLIEEGGFRVQRGDDSETALRKALRSRAPVIVLEGEASPKEQASGTVSLLLNTALGFGVKLALDRMAQRLTGEEEIVDAVTEPDGVEPRVVSRPAPGPEPRDYPRVEPADL